MSEQNKTAKAESKAELKNEERRRPVAPAVDIYEGREEFLLVADLPGVKQEDLTVKLHQNELSFEGRRRPAAAGSLLSGRNEELLYKRSFTLPGGIDADKIEAKLQAGVLQLRLPKASAYKPRQISVTAG